MQAAATAGSVRCLEMLSSVDCPVDAEAASEAANAGQLEALKWLCANDCPIDVEQISCRAVSSGNVEMIQFVHSELSAQYTEQNLRTAVQYTEFDSEHLTHLSVVQYLVQQHGLTITTEMCQLAVYQHSLSLLQWLLDTQGLQLSTELYGYAFICSQSKDDLETIRWLREVAHCPWDTMHLSRQALQRHSLDVLDYMQQQGVQYTADELTSLLAYAGCKDVTKKQTCVRDDDVPLHLAVIQGIAWLRQRGAAWPAVLAWHRESDDQSVPWVQKEVIAWVREQGCTAPKAKRPWEMRWPG